MTPFLCEKLHKVGAHATSWLVFVQLLQLNGFCRKLHFAKIINSMIQQNQRFLAQARIANAIRHFAISNLT